MILSLLTPAQAVICSSVRKLVSLLTVNKSYKKTQAKNVLVHLSILSEFTALSVAVMSPSQVDRFKKKKKIKRTFLLGSLNVLSKVYADLSIES